MSRPGLLAAVLLGCGGARSAAPPAPPPAPPPPPPVVAGEAGIGPITGETPANLAALREAMPGFTVKAVNDGMFDELHFAVSRGGELLFYVIPSDDGTLFNVHVMSSQVVLANKVWRAGARLASASYLSHCECWGGMPVCYRRGEHLAIAFEQDCDTTALATPEGRKALQGELIHRAVWSPRPFSEGPDPNDPDGGDGSGGGGDPCGGDPCGGDPCAGP